MKRLVPHIVSLAAVTGLLAMTPNMTHAQNTDPQLANPADQSLFPQITLQPLDQVVPLGSNVVLLADANNADSCQWLKNGAPLAGQTNNVLLIVHAGLSDVGLYSCEFFNGGPVFGATVPTRAATVEVETTGSTTSGLTASKSTTASALAASPMTAGISGGEPITVMGTPYPGSGSGGTCPGPYTGYIVYSKSVSQGWGWAPTPGATTLTATDGSGRTNTKVQYFGAYGDNGCGQTTVTIPYPPFSPVYEFAIYFTNNVPASTNGYPLILNGFNP